MTNALFVAWRSGEPTGGEWGPVGVLERAEKGGYRFAYTQGARTLPGFRPFPGMSDLNEVYESDELFPIFAIRLLNKRRPEYKPWLIWSGFDPDHPPDPIAILGVTEGLRATDSLELFSCPIPDAGGCYANKFFLHGVRHMPEAARERVDRLQNGEPLGFMFDVSNPYDRQAVAVRTCDTAGQFLIGYVPRYLAREFHRLDDACGAGSVQLAVERVNIGAPFQQRLLCRMTGCWPADYSPCADDEFQPIVERVPSVAV